MHYWTDSSQKTSPNFLLTQLMSSNKCSVSEGLENLRETITKFSPKGPATFRSEQDKTEYLLHVVIGLDWAEDLLTQSIASTPAGKPQKLCTALDATWIVEQKQNDRNWNDSRVIYTGKDYVRYPGIHYDVSFQDYSQI